MDKFACKSGIFGAWRFSAQSWRRCQRGVWKLECMGRAKTKRTHCRFAWSCIRERGLQVECHVDESDGAYWDILASTRASANVLQGK